MSARIFAAYGVHLFTVSGVIFGFLALIATTQGDVALAFLYLGIALVIDSVDGTLARLVKVKDNTPEVDGSTLDNVIDYFTYVLIPAFMVWQWGLAPDGGQTLVACIVILAGTYTYAMGNAKTDDHCFVGFPALWNIVVFYIVLLGIGPWTTAALIVACAILTAIPTPYIHAFRTPMKGFEWLNWMFVLVWTVSAGILGNLALYQERSAADFPIWFLLFSISSVYFVALSIFWPLISSRNP